MITAKEKQRAFLDYFFEHLYSNGEYKLKYGDKIIVDKSTIIYLSSSDNRGGEIMITPTFGFTNTDLRKVALEAGVDHFAFEQTGVAYQGTRMAAEIGYFDNSVIYNRKYSLGYPPPPDLNRDNFLGRSLPKTTYRIANISEIPGAFEHHKYFMEQVGFRYIELMKTPEGVDQVYNDILFYVSEEFINSEEGRDKLLGHFYPALRTIYSLISAKLVSDDRYRAVLERQLMLKHENPLIVEYFDKVVKYLGK